MNDGNNNLFPVWQQVERLIDQQISVIPIRDRDETTAYGKVYAKKTPYADWKQYQTEIISKPELFAQIEKYKTAAVAIICGAVSGNLELIDVDVKWYPGIDSILFTTLKELYPEIYEILRTHGTPSTGSHLLYRVTGGIIPGNQKLAGRPSTGDELLISPKQKNKYFIETRGEGGYAVAPPSLGYTIRRDVPIPVLTWEQRCAIIELCKAFDQTISTAQVYKPTKRDETYYEENPFEHFNRTCDPVELLQRFDWRLEKQTAGYIWFTKPGGKKGDVHGSYNKAKNVFHVFTTNTNIEGDRAYQLCTVLSHYQFNGDKKQTYSWLVQNGYGRIKPHIEQRMVKSHAISGQPLPANASAEAQTRFIEVRANLDEAHPHGIFWEPNNDSDGFTISRMHLKECANGLGFRLFNAEIVRIINGVIHKQNESEFYDTILEYINEEDADLYKEIYNATDAHLQKNGKWLIDRLTPLETEKILIDTRTCCYKFYNNGIVKITANEIDLITYESITQAHLIWGDKIQPRDYIHTTADGLFTDFMKLALNLNESREHIMRCIGWLAHDYKDTTTAYIVVFVEQCANPEEGGGAGKNLLGTMLSYTTSYLCVNGRQNKNAAFDDLFQPWNGERILAISETGKDFDFEALKEPASGTMQHKKLFKNRVNLSVDQTPKFIILTNYSFEITDGGLRRRIIPLEFTGFFNKSNTIDQYFGKYFPNDFTYVDWANYDTFICESIQLWLQNNCKLHTVELSETGWEKQFGITYGPTISNFIQEYWLTCFKDKFISTQDFNKLLWQYVEENNIQSKYKPTSYRLNQALRQWCDKLGYTFNAAANSGGFVNERGRSFFKNEKST